MKTTDILKRNGFSTMFDKTSFRHSLVMLAPLVHNENTKATQSILYLLFGYHPQFFSSLVVLVVNSPVTQKGYFRIMSEL
jgi:hypothetical protein